jgi:hypothetical protein
VVIVTHDGNREAPEGLPVVLDLDRPKARRLVRCSGVDPSNERYQPVMGLHRGSTENYSSSVLILVGSDIGGRA